MNSSVPSAPLPRARRSEFLPFALPHIGEEEIAEVVDSLRSGWITTGPKAARFEQDFARYIGCDDAVGVNSCTAALHVALSTFGIGAGDEVIVPTLTFCATANVVVHTGARPVLVDVDVAGNIDVEAAARAITSRTKAIMPVHFAGQPADMVAIYELAAKHKLAVIEDGAHAVGAEFGGFKLGSRDYFASVNSAGVSAAIAFSFYANKNMTTGEGGMLVFAAADSYEKARVLRLHGMSKDAWNRYTSAGSWFYEVVEAGFKYNLTDIGAAIGLHQLRRLDGFTDTRKAFAAYYDDALQNIPDIHLPHRIPGRDHVFHLYPIRVGTSLDRDQVIEELKARNIGTSVHFIPIHMHKFYAREFDYAPGDFPSSESYFASTISLPMYPGMSYTDLDDVVDALRDTVSA